MKKVVLSISAILLCCQSYADDDALTTTRKSYWQGARIAYNIDGASIDNVIGSAKVAINPFSKNGEGFFGADWAIVGNFGNFVSALNEGSVDQDIKKLAQQAQGLNLGIGGVRSFPLSETKGNSGPVFRAEFITGYRLNGFQDVGPDSIDVVINQFRNSLALEIESGQWVNGGTLHFGIEGAATVLDRERYKKVFNATKDVLLNAEATIILPISVNIGILMSGTYSPDFSPVYQFGILIHPANGS